MLLWLEENLGYVLGVIVFYVLSRLFNVTVAELRKKYADYVREQDQKKKQEQLEQDVQEQKPRDEKTKKDEEDWLNS